ncbi:MAG: ROK family protein [Candidatus Omnitrophota bacterium]
MKYAIGIDVGGTKISVTLGTSSGKILARKKVTTRILSKSKACVEEILTSVRQIFPEFKLSSKDILGIGIGAPGAVNSKTGVLPRSPNLAGWAGIPIVRIFRNKFKLPIYLANDANAAALGEWVFGAGRKMKNLIYITVSTGVGGGLILNGQLYEGAGFVAGEIGHISVVPEGRKCKCGRRGCLEAYASGTAIAHFYNELKKKKVKGAKEVGLAASSGDKVAIESYRKAAYYLGIGLANLMNVLNPEAIVIGGGVLKSAPPVYWKEVLRSAKGHAWPEAFQTTKVLQSPLLGHSGDLGALALVFKNSK